MKKLILILSNLLLAICCPAAVITVDDDGPADFSNVQDALAAATYGDRIHVVQGTYKPDRGSSVSLGDRYATFQLLNGVAVYGGFAFAQADPNQRDPNAYPTVLSGDLNGDDGPDFTNNDENSYHVVTGSGTDATALLDGVTITSGNANGYWEGDGTVGGGGLYNESGNPTIANSTFTGNSATDDGGSYPPGPGFGGAMLNLNDSSPVINDCTFNDNSANEGGAMYNRSNSCPLVTNSIFGNNSAIYGGAIYNYQSGPSLTDCIVSGNSSVYDGGGIACSDGPITNCIITKNDASWEGSGGGLFGCSGPITGCIIANNSCEWSSGGGLAGCSGPITDCIIANNVAWSGFGDVPSISGGGLAYCDGPISNCVIVNNVSWNTDSVYSPSRGGGIAFCDGTIINCTIAGNVAFENSYGSIGGGVADCNGTISNCIIWNNSATNDPQISSSVPPTYSCIQSWPGGSIGNINNDPCFAQLGYWDDNGTPTDPSDDIIIDGDYHLKSAAGRWNPAVQSWVSDDVNSPCIDAGDPASDWTEELWPHGKRINMGAFGGTAEASMSNSAAGNIADLNCNGKVNFHDYALFAADFHPDNSLTIAAGRMVVDGNLDDWSGNTEWIALDKVYYGNPQDIAEARFALRWSSADNKIYVAVIVQDSSHVFADDYGTWDSSDRLEIYSQGDAAGGTGWWHWLNPTYDAAQQYIVAPDTTGGAWAAWGNGWPLDPDTDFEFAVNVEGDRIIYEAGVKQFDNYGGISVGETIVTKLSAGHVVGFDVVVDTRSATDFGMLSENLMTEKYRDADSFAKYTLADDVSGIAAIPATTDLDRNCILDFADLTLLTDDWLWQQ